MKQVSGKYAIKIVRSSSSFKSFRLKASRGLYLAFTCIMAATSAFSHGTGIALANDAFKTICHVGRAANLSGSSGKNEIAVAIMKNTGYSKKTSERIAQKIIDENCPGVW